MAYRAAEVVVGAGAVVVRGPRVEVVGGGVVAAAQLAHARQTIRREGDVVVKAWVGAAKDLVGAGPGRLIRIGCEVACHARVRTGGLQALREFTVLGAQPAPHPWLYLGRVDAVV